MKIQKPSLQVIRFSDNDVIATSAITPVYRPNGMPLLDFAQKRPSDQEYATIGTEYVEYGGNENYKGYWPIGELDEFLNYMVIQSNHQWPFALKNTIIYVWWDNTDKSWRTDGKFLKDYSVNEADYISSGDDWPAVWKTN